MPWLWNDVPWKRREGIIAAAMIPLCKGAGLLPFDFTLGLEDMVVNPDLCKMRTMLLERHPLNFLFQETQDINPINVSR